MSTTQATETAPRFTYQMWDTRGDFAANRTVYTDVDLITKRAARLNRQRGGMIFTVKVIDGTKA